MPAGRFVLIVSGAVSVDLVFVAAGNSGGLRNSFWHHHGAEYHARHKRSAAAVEPLATPHAFAGSDVLEFGSRQRLWRLSSVNFCLGGIEWRRPSLDLL